MDWKPLAVGAAILSFFTFAAYSAEGKIDRAYATGAIMMSWMAAAAVRGRE